MSIPLVDPLDRRLPLSREGDELVSPSGRRYSFAGGIARFPGTDDAKQVQTAASFGYKWTRQANWGLRGSDGHIVWDLWRSLYGFESPAVIESLMRGKTVLDAGSGSGVALRQFVDWPSEVAVVDLSNAIDACRDQLGGRPNLTFVQADVHALPFPDSVFDVIWSTGVLHHTPDTFTALSALARHLKPGGRILFYVYVTKGPIREFVDDHVRAAISDLPPDEAWRRMEALTKLGRSLAALTEPLVVEDDVPELEFRAGTYSVQRFAYYNLFKCFWNDALTFEENVHVNFDWYHPKYAHRQTPEQVRGWLARLGLEEESVFVGESGITTIARRPLAP